MVYNRLIQAIKSAAAFYSMIDPKIYLNVPFAQKDEAKALGARWDAVQKKWYAPADKDITLFAKWQAESGTVTVSGTKALSAKISASSKTTTANVKTHATIKDFVAYNGDAPPWD